MSRRNGENPATFATELEILAVQGFGEVGQTARTRMVRDRFILGQRDCSPGGGDTGGYRQLLELEERGP